LSSFVIFITQTCQVEKNRAVLLAAAEGFEPSASGALPSGQQNGSNTYSFVIIIPQTKPFVVNDVLWFY